jgi:hypothetical protein
MAGLTAAIVWKSKAAPQRRGLNLFLLSDKIKLIKNKEKQQVKPFLIGKIRILSLSCSIYECVIKRNGLQCLLCATSVMSLGNIFYLSSLPFPHFPSS